MLEKIKGKYVLIRTEQAGVHLGNLVDYDLATQCVELTNTRRIHYWQRAFTLSAIAKRGLGGDTRLSCIIDSIFLIGVIEVIPINNPATIKLLQEYPEHQIDNPISDDE